MAMHALMGPWSCRVLKCSITIADRRRQEEEGLSVGPAGAGVPARGRGGACGGYGLHMRDRVRAEPDPGLFCTIYES